MMGNRSRRLESRVPRKALNWFNVAVSFPVDPAVVGSD
jgi:hypothetical protein